MKAEWSLMLCGVAATWGTTAFLRVFLFVAVLRVDDVGLWVVDFVPAAGFFAVDFAVAEVVVFFFEGGVVVSCAWSGETQRRMVSRARVRRRRNGCDEFGQCERMMLTCLLYAAGLWIRLAVGG
jgi:hypothetical protein